MRRGSSTWQARTQWSLASNRCARVNAIRSLSMRMLSRRRCGKVVNAKRFSTQGAHSSITVMTFGHLNFDGHRSLHRLASGYNPHGTAFPILSFDSISLHSERLSPRLQWLRGLSRSLPL
jgi:hypothetical protein